MDVPWTAGLVEEDEEEREEDDGAAGEEEEEEEADDDDDDEVVVDATADAAEVAEAALEAAEPAEAFEASAVTGAGPDAVIDEDFAAAKYSSLPPSMTPLAYLTESCSTDEAATADEVTSGFTELAESTTVRAAAGFAIFGSSAEFAGCAGVGFSSSRPSVHPMPRLYAASSSSALLTIEIRVATSVLGYCRNKPLRVIQMDSNGYFRQSRAELCLINCEKVERLP